MAPVTPRQIPMQKEKGSQPLLSIQRKKTAGVARFHAAVNEVQIQRRPGTLALENQRVVKGFQKVIAHVLFRFTALRVVPLYQRYLDPRTPRKELTEGYRLIEVT